MNPILRNINMESRNQTEGVFVIVLRKRVAAASLMALMVVGLSFGISSKLADAAKENCGAYPSRAAAQAAYDADPVGHARLDGRDRDGKVCETFNYKAKASDARPSFWSHFI